jgi:hypothetical protein
MEPQFVVIVEWSDHTISCFGPFEHIHQAETYAIDLERHESSVFEWRLRELWPPARDAVYGT